MSDDTRSPETRSSRTPWNKGKLTGPKPPLKVREIWAIRIRLQLAERLRDLALFNLAIDSKLRGCDLVALRVRDVAHGGTVAHRAIVLQHKTQQPVQFELTDQTRESVAATNARALGAFRYHVIHLWRRTLRRRSQKDGMTSARMARIADAWLPRPRILHPWPERRFAVTHPRWEPSARIAPAGICAGGAR